MALIIQKYGGSSLATPSHIRRAAERIKGLKENGTHLAVVVSAMGHTTDHLLRLAYRTVKKPPQRELDMLLSAGERVSMALLAMALEEMGIAAISFTGSQSGILTSNDHTEARIIDIRAVRIQEELRKGKVVIIAGFQGVSEKKEITTLGRGGSDTTAVALAAALAADYCEILTDVAGIYSADPRLVSDARLLSSSSYDESLEFASLGAKMHSRSLELAKRYAVKVRVCSSKDMESKGTEISEHLPRHMEQVKVRGIASREGYFFFKTRAPLIQLTQILGKERLPLRFFTFDEHEVRFLVEGEKVPYVRDILIRSEVSFDEIPNIALVSAVGEGLASSADTLPQFLNCLSNTPIYLIVNNSLSMSAAIPRGEMGSVVRKLHEVFSSNGLKRGQSTFNE